MKSQPLDNPIRRRAPLHLSPATPRFLAADHEHRDTLRRDNKSPTIIINDNDNRQIVIVVHMYIARTY